MSISRKVMFSLAAALITSLLWTASFAGGSAGPVAPRPTTNAPIPNPPPPVYFCYPNPFAPAGETCILLN
jgi:hypothetical protein